MAATYAPRPQAPQTVQEPKVSCKKCTSYIIFLIVVGIICLILVGVVVYLLLFRKSTSTCPTLSKAGESCTSNPCAVGLSCELGVCLLGIGADCSSGLVACVADTICQKKTGETTSTCHGTWLSTCANSAQCALGVCRDGRCQPPATCVTSADCGTVNGAYYTCQSGTCQPLIIHQAGGTCNLTTACEPPSSCVAGTCA